MKKFFKKPVVITLLALALIALIYGLQFGFKIYMMISNPRPAPTVSTVEVGSDTWNKSFTAVGTIRSPYGTLLRAEASGRVTDILCQAGDEVKKGDLLLVIDAQSERAAANLAKLTYERAKELRAKNVNTQNDLDQALSAYEQAKAALDKKEIRAPFDGKVGIAQVYLGQYAQTGDALVSVENLSMMNADFAVPQRDADLIEMGGRVEMSVDAYEGEIFEGKIVGVDPRVDETTRNLMVRASFDNADEKLRSGMFASIKIVLSTQQEALTVPSTAIVYSAYGEYVYKVVLEGDKDKATTSVKQVFVKTGDRIGDYVAILDGLKEGDEIVSEGQMKLRNGVAIQIDNSDMPENSMAPTPQES